MNVKPSLSMKILRVNNFSTKLLSKHFSGHYIGVYLKGTRKFGSKVINGQFLHRKTVFICKYYLILISLPSFLVSKTNFWMDLNRKITKKFTKRFTKKSDSKVIIRQYLHRKTGLKTGLFFTLLQWTFEIRQFIKWYAWTVVRLSKGTTNQASDVPSIIFS